MKKINFFSKISILKKIVLFVALGMTSILTNKIVIYAEESSAISESTNIKNTEVLLEGYGTLVCSYEEQYGKMDQTTLYGWLNSLTGVCVLELIDFNNDDQNELLLVYSEENAYGNNTYTYEIWGYSENEICKLSEGEVSATGDGSQYLTVVRHAGNKYLMIEDGCDLGFRYYWGYDGNKFTTVRKMVSQWDNSQEQYICIFEGRQISMKEWMQDEEAWYEAGTVYYLSAKDLSLAKDSVKRTKKIIFGDATENGEDDFSNIVYMEVAYCNEYITLRSSASTLAEELDRILLGEVVEYIESADNGFYKVSYKGKKGYVLSSYLK